MISFKLFLENDEKHSDSLRKTGFWGKQGAGSIVLAKNTGRLLIPHRSKYVQEPNTWGVWGGAIDNEENPKEAAKRELEEEAGYQGNIEMIPLSVFSQNSFRYYNFLAIIDEEFEPQLNWETQAYKWISLDNLPSPLHFGLQWLISQDKDKIQTIIDEYK